MGKSLYRYVRNDFLTYANVAESGISKQLMDKMYEKRKAAALELEK